MNHIVRNVKIATANLIIFIVTNVKNAIMSNNKIVISVINAKIALFEQSKFLIIVLITRINTKTFLKDYIHIVIIANHAI